MTAGQHHEHFAELFNGVSTQGTGGVDTPFRQPSGQGFPQALQGVKRLRGINRRWLRAGALRCGSGLVGPHEQKGSWCVQGCTHERCPQLSPLHEHVRRFEQVLPEYVGSDIPGHLQRQAEFCGLGTALIR